METLPFWPYSYILWKVVYRNTRCRSIILVANIIWRSVHEIRSSSQALYISSINSFSFRLYCLKAGKPVVQSRVLIHSSLILFSYFSHSYLSLRNKQPRRGGGWGKFEHLGNLLLWSISFLSFLFPFSFLTRAKEFL